MISSEEFQQQLQSGQIHQALALVSRDPTLLDRGFTHELDVTTRMTPGSTIEREYLRTKINLLTGEIHNEVSPHLLTDRQSYNQLQQLHIDQIVASYRLVQGHLDRVKAILTALPAAQPPAAAIDRASPGAGQVNDKSLPTRLTQSLSILTEHHRNVASTQIDTGEFDEIDLSIHDDEIWEEWVEDDDFPPEPNLPQPTPVTAELQLPDLQEHWVRRPLNPIDVKPIIPRSPPGSRDRAERWDKFVPECIEIDPTTTDRSQPHH